MNNFTHSRILSELIDFYYIFNKRDAYIYNISRLYVFFDTFNSLLYGTIILNIYYSNTNLNYRFAIIFVSEF